MRVKTLQILWHDKQPVFSVDFSPTSNELATCGADKEIRLWKVVDRERDAASSGATPGAGRSKTASAVVSSPRDPKEEDRVLGVEYLCNLSAHSKTVNVVRFSPDGSALVSAGDSGEVVMWRKQKPTGREDKAKTPSKGEGAGEKTQVASPSPSTPGFGRERDDRKSASWWKAVGSLRGQTDDVQDLAWSPDSTAVVTGSVENVAFLWDAGKHKALRRLDGHHHYIQGVAWDPLGDFIVTQSVDRSCRVYAPKPKPKRKKETVSDLNPTCASRIHSYGVSLQHVLARLHAAGAKAKAEGEKPSSKDKDKTGGGSPPSPSALVGPDHLPQAKEAKEAGAPPLKKQKVDQAAAPPAPFLFHDENMPSFFRRLSWSPDGAFLACPAGVYKKKGGHDKKGGNCVHIFKRKEWTKPIVTLPVLTKAVVAVKFCPVLFEQSDPLPPQEEIPEADGKGPSEVLELKHKICFAVLTLDSIILYETESMKPTTLISGIHCAALTDLAWSPDGRMIAVSSHDGYCSLVSFAENELGTPIPPKPEESAKAGVPEAAQGQDAVLVATADPPATPAAQTIKASQATTLERQTVQVVRDPNTNTTRKRIAPMPIRR